MKPDGKTFKWYKKVSVERYSYKGVDGYFVLLDNRVMLTEKRKLVHVPNELIAVAVANEWQAQGSTINTSLMPLMRLVYTAMEWTPSMREKIIDGILSQFEADNFLFSYPEHEILLRETVEKYQLPIVRWFEDKYQVKLNMAENVSKEQPAKALLAVSEFLSGLDDWQLTAVETIVTNSKSVLLAMAIQQDEVDVEHAVKAAQTEQDVQTAKWGTMENGHDLETFYNKIELSAGAFFLHASGSHKILGG